MEHKTERPYGLWTSPISPKSLAEGRRLGPVAWDSDGQTLVWLEGRSGRGVLVAQGPTADAPRDLTTDLEVRAEVGYGGGDFTVHGGYVYFVVSRTGRIFRQALAGGPAVPISPAFGKAASPTVSPDGRWVAYVHHDEDGIDRLAIVDTQGRAWAQILTEGHDFYMQPRWSPDGSRLAWVAWDHPEMPWDSTRLYVADVVRTNGTLARLKAPRVIAGGEEVAIFQPEFLPDGRQLLYVSDVSGWGQLVLHDLASGVAQQLTSDTAEYGMPAWVQGMSTYAVSSDGRSVTAVRNEQGVHHLVRVAVPSGQTTVVSELAEYSEVASLTATTSGDRIAFVGSHPTVPARIVTHDFSRGPTRIAARSQGETIRHTALAEAQPVSWSAPDGSDVFGLYYAPTNERYQGTGKPPLIVVIHGGPTSQVLAGWRPDAQFFATRGYAVLYVNYRGSTGYGRAYMLKLRANWGVADVEDAVGGARHLAEAGQIDPDRTVIMGGSAGGFTVLQTMVEHPQVFRAGICMYGVADQFQLAAETHKFEARYLDSLLGPLPEAAAIYRQRSPVLHAAKIRRPMAVFQGSNDRVVPREQSDAIVQALARNNVPHLYHVYEGEGHGWRKKETIEHFYRTVEEFLRRHVLFA
jgi:dipeptidyl aminopeptidase/acylaminoacyl peptidase